MIDNHFDYEIGAHTLLADAACTWFGLVALFRSLKNWAPSNSATSSNHLKMREEITVCFCWRPFAKNNSSPGVYSFDWTIGSERKMHHKGWSRHKTNRGEYEARKSPFKLYLLIHDLHNDHSASRVSWLKTQRPRMPALWPPKRQITPLRRAFLCLFLYYFNAENAVSFSTERTTNL